MLLKLAAEFDPFLEEHFKRYSNAGSGRTPNLSRTACYEFTKVTAAKLLEVITAEVKTTKCYSISVDSTPDTSHIDQLSLII